MDTWTIDPDEMLDRPMSPEEVKRRRDVYDAERERRWQQQVESDDPPEWDDINGGYI